MCNENQKEVSVLTYNYTVGNNLVDSAVFYGVTESKEEAETKLKQCIIPPLDGEFSIMTYVLERTPWSKHVWTIVEDIWDSVHGWWVEVLVGVYETRKKAREVSRHIRRGWNGVRQTRIKCVI